MCNYPSPLTDEVQWCRSSKCGDVIQTCDGRSFDFDGLADIIINMIFMTISTDQHFHSQIIDGSGHPLSGVLVSLSGANFRSNNFSKEDGRLDYHGLVIKWYLRIIVYEHFLYRYMSVMLFCVWCELTAESWPVLHQAIAKGVWIFPFLQGIWTTHVYLHKYVLRAVYVISHLGSRGKRRPQWGHHIHWY